MRTVAALSVLLTVLAAAPAAASSITELGCFEAPAVERGCTKTVGLEGAAAVAVSPDARHVYVGGNVEEHGVLLTFARDLATGGLTPQGCLADNARDGCTPSEALFGVNDVAISRDGRTVYALGILPGSVGVFRRDLETGALTQMQCVQEGYRSQTCPRAPFENPWKFALTADGATLIVAGSHVTSFAVGADGLLAAAASERVGGVRNPAAIAASADPRRVYVAGGSEDRGRLSVLERDPETGAFAVRRCSSDGISTGPECLRADGMHGPTDLAVSPDGKGVYMTSSSFTSADPADPFSFDGVQNSSAISVFAPARVVPTRCVLFAGRERDRGDCRRAPDERGAGFFGASAIAVTPDGKVAVAGFDKSSAVLLLGRNPKTQALAPLAGRAACVRDPGRRPRIPRGCAAGRGIDAPSDIAISPDARNAYVTTPGGLAVFALALD
jgi:DNA-binding beta-propeller fold protein YncE